MRVKLPDGRTFTGVVTALDTSTDLAVVKLEGIVGNLPVMSLGKDNRCLSVFGRAEGGGKGGVFGGHVHIKPPVMSLSEDIIT